MRIERKGEVYVRTIINECLALDLLFHKVSLRKVIDEVMAAISDPPEDIGTEKPPGLSWTPRKSRAYVKNHFQSSQRRLSLLHRAS